MTTIFIAAIGYFVLAYIIAFAILTAIGNIYLLSGIFAFAITILITERKHHVGKKYR